jgi:hypothetical protein
VDKVSSQWGSPSAPAPRYWLPGQDSNLRSGVQSPEPYQLGHPAETTLGWRPRLRQAPHATGLPAIHVGPLINPDAYRGEGSPGRAGNVCAAQCRKRLSPLVPLLTCFPASPRSVVYGADGRSRTRDPLGRSQPLCPLSYVGDAVTARTRTGTSDGDRRRSISALTPALR